MPDYTEYLDAEQQAWLIGHPHTLPQPCGVEEQLRIQQRDDATAANVANAADYSKAVDAVKGL